MSGRTIYSTGIPMLRWMHLRSVPHGPVHTAQDDTILINAGRAALDVSAQIGRRLTRIGVG